MARSLRLVRESAGDPTLDTALSRVILDRVSGGDDPETLRLYRPQAHVAFGRQDAVHPRYPAAVAAARAEGFDAVERLAGGRAAVFHEDTVAFAWAVPDASPRERIRERFEEVAALVVATLIKLGVEARVGEVPGEYCPGEWSVNARGRAKLMGVGQRVVRAATHVGGVIVVGGADRVRDVLVPVYRALEFPWDPATTGSIDAEIGAVDVDIVADAFAHEVGLVHDLGETPLDPALLRASEERRDEFTPPG